MTQATFLFFTLVGIHERTALESNGASNAAGVVSYFFVTDKSSLVWIDNK